MTDKLKKLSSILKPRNSETSQKSKSQNTYSYNIEYANEEQSRESLSKCSIKKRKISYEEELILLIYTNLLDILIEEYIVHVPEIPEYEVQEEESINQEKSIKDFYNITMDELQDAEILFIQGPKVSLSKKNTNANPSSNLWNTFTFSVQLIIISSVNLESYSTKSRGSATNYTEYLVNFTILLNIFSTILCLLKEEEEPSNTDNWFVPYETENMTIKYKNGNVYEGSLLRKLFHGDGTFKWTNGVIYEVIVNKLLFLFLIIPFHSLGEIL